MRLMHRGTVDFCSSGFHQKSQLIVAGKTISFFLIRKRNPKLANQFSCRDLPPTSKILQDLLTSPPSLYLSTLNSLLLPRFSRCYQVQNSELILKVFNNQSNGIQTMTETHRTFLNPVDTHPLFSILHLHLPLSHPNRAMRRGKRGSD